MIDNRIFALVFTSFAWVLLCRALFWVAGLEWADSAGRGALIIAACGTYVVGMVLFCADIDLGKTRLTLWGRK